MLNIAKIGECTKFLLNRAFGVKYGCVKFGGGPIQLVKTKKLYKLNGRLIDKINDYSPELLPKDFRTILRQTKPFHTGVDDKVFKHNLSYINAHGRMQVWDKDVEKPVIDIVEELGKPIKTYFKYKA